MIVRTDLDQTARDDGIDSDHVTPVQRTWTDVRDMFGDAAVLRQRYPIKHFIVAPYRPMSRRLMLAVKESK